MFSIPLTESLIPSYNLYAEEDYYPTTTTTTYNTRRTRAHHLHPSKLTSSTSSPPIPPHASPTSNKPTIHHPPTSVPLHPSHAVPPPQHPPHTYLHPPTTPTRLPTYLHPSQPTSRSTPTSTHNPQRGAEWRRKENPSQLCYPAVCQACIRHKLAQPAAVCSWFC